MAPTGATGPSFSGSHTGICNARCLPSRLHPCTPPCWRRIRRCSLATTRFIDGWSARTSRRALQAQSLPLRAPGLHWQFLGPLIGACRNFLRKRALPQPPCGHLPGGSLRRFQTTGAAADDYAALLRNCFRLVTQQDAVDWILTSMTMAATISVNKFVFRMDWTQCATSRQYRRHEMDTGESAVDSRRTRRDTSRRRGRSSSIPRASFPLISPKGRSPSPAFSTAPSFGPRPRSTSPHNKQDLPLVEPTITKRIIERKALPPLDLDDEVPRKPYMKPAPLHLLQEDARPALAPKAKPPPANLNTTSRSHRQHLLPHPRLHLPGASRSTTPGTTTKRTSRRWWRPSRPWQKRHPRFVFIKLRRLAIRITPLRRISTTTIKAHRQQAQSMCPIRGSIHTSLDDGYFQIEPLPFQRGVTQARAPRSTVDHKVRSPIWRSHRGESAFHRGEGPARPH